MALAACIRRRDVESEKAEIRAVTHDRYRAHRHIIEQADEKPRRIGDLESPRVVEAGIPALGGGPIERARQIGRGHCDDFERSGHGARLSEDHNFVDSPPMGTRATLIETSPKLMLVPAGIGTGWPGVRRRPVM